MRKSRPSAKYYSIQEKLRVVPLPFYVVLNFGFQLDLVKSSSSPPIHEQEHFMNMYLPSVQC